MAIGSGSNQNGTNYGMILSGAGQISGAVSEYYALQAQSEYQRQISEVDQKLSAFQAETAIKQGNVEAKKHREEVSALVGAQRASLAAQGLDPNAGSALEIQAQTAERGARDAVTIKNNAWLSAWGIKVEATNRRYQSQFNAMSSKNRANATLVTGGLQSAGSFTQAYLNRK